MIEKTLAKSGKSIHGNVLVQRREADVKLVIYLRICNPCSVRYKIYILVKDLNIRVCLFFSSISTSNLIKMPFIEMQTARVHTTSEDRSFNV